MFPLGTGYGMESTAGCRRPAGSYAEPKTIQGLDVGAASVPQPRPPPGERTRKLLDPGAVGAPREERLLGLGEKAKGRLLAGSR